MTKVLHSILERVTISSQQLAMMTTTLLTHGYSVEVLGVGAGQHTIKIYWIQEVRHAVTH
ncbi:MAG: hypothetical protein RLZZ422_1490 [Pseudomonadota bacterium]|jgi:hypothetical protein